MNPARVKGANLELGAPPSWDTAKHGECRALPVLDCGDLYQSAWFPTPEELHAMIHGHPVILTIYGRSHPPVYLDVGGSPGDASAMFCAHGEPDPMKCHQCLRVLMQAKNLSGPPS